MIANNYTRFIIFFITGYFLFLLMSTNGCSSSQNTNAHITDTVQKMPDSKLYKIEINNMKFEPAELKVKKGDKVVFVNYDMMLHDVTEEQHKSWSSSPLKTGEYWMLTVTENVNYFCSLHQVMKGKIVVE